MSDTLMSIIGIFFAVILMFIFPALEMANKTDEIAQTVSQVVVTDFVNKVASKGKITEFDYNELQQKLYATGNSYDIQIEVQILDDNPQRTAVTNSGGTDTGEIRYYSLYTNTILEKLSATQEYFLKKDDYIIVTAKSTNITIGTQFKNMFYKLIGKDTYAIGVSATAKILNTNEKITF